MALRHGYVIPYTYRFVSIITYTFAWVEFTALVMHDIKGRSCETDDRNNRNGSCKHGLDIQWPHVPHISSHWLDRGNEKTAQPRRSDALIVCNVFTSIIRFCKIGSHCRGFNSKVIDSLNKLAIVLSYTWLWATNQRFLVPLVNGKGSQTARH